MEKSIGIVMCVIGSLGLILAVAGLVLSKKPMQHIKAFFYHLSQTIEKDEEKIKAKEESLDEKAKSLLKSLGEDFGDFEKGIKDANVDLKMVKEKINGTGEAFGNIHTPGGIKLSKNVWNIPLPDLDIKLPDVVIPEFAQDLGDLTVKGFTHGFDSIELKAVETADNFLHIPEKVLDLPPIEIPEQITKVENFVVKGFNQIMGDIAWDGFTIPHHDFHIPVIDKDVGIGGWNIPGFHFKLPDIHIPDMPFSPPVKIPFQKILNPGKLSIDGHQVPLPDFKISTHQVHLKPIHIPDQDFKLPNIKIPRQVLKFEKLLTDKGKEIHVPLPIPELTWIAPFEQIQEAMNEVGEKIGSLEQKLAKVSQSAGNVNQKLQSKGTDLLTDATAKVGKLEKDMEKAADLAEKISSNKWLHFAPQLVMGAVAAANAGMIALGIHLIMIAG